MKTILNSDEVLIHESGASLHYGIIGGHLYLTSQRIIFEPNDLNPIRKTTISLGDINNIRVERRKFLWIIPMNFSWKLLISTSQEKCYHLIVYEGERWKKIIMDIIKIK